MNLKVEKEKVLKAAKTYGGKTEQVLRDLFPEVFEEEYFEFGSPNLNNSNFELNTFSSPLHIGCGNAQDGDKFKVLIVDLNYEVEVIPNYYYSSTGLKFKKIS